MYIQRIQNMNINPANIEKIKGVVITLNKMIEIYKNYPEERNSTIFVTALADLIYEISLAIQKFDLCLFEELSSSFEILLDNCKGESLLKVTISLQILIESDKTYKISNYFTEDIWNKIFSGILDPNKDISQSHKDIITYLIISRQKIPFDYPLISTVQDVYISKSLKKLNTL